MEEGTKNKIVAVCPGCYETTERVFKRAYLIKLIQCDYCGINFKWHSMSAAPEFSKGHPKKLTEQEALKLVGTYSKTPHSQRGED